MLYCLTNQTISMRNLKPIKISGFETISEQEMKTIFGGSGDASSIEVCKHPGARCSNNYTDSGSGDLIGSTYGVCTTRIEESSGESGAIAKKYYCDCVSQGTVSSGSNAELTVVNNCD